MFFFRKTVEALVDPLMLVLLALTIGCILRLRTNARLRRVGEWLVASGVAAIVCLAYGLPFDFIARALEDRYSALDIATVPANVRWIEVLGGAARVRPGMPVSAYPTEGSIYRIVEGVRLQHALPNSKIIFSGYAPSGGMSTAASGTALAESLGVSPEQIVTEERPRTTAEEAQRVRTIVGTEPFILVTSALHMPRAMILFRQQGMSPIAAPTGERSVLERRTLEDWVKPSATRIALAGDTWHELLGLLAASVLR